MLSIDVGELVSFGFWMQKQGHRKSTIRYCLRALRSAARHSNLQDPESTKSYLAHANITESRKAKLAEDLARYYHYKKVFDKNGFELMGVDSKGNVVAQSGVK